MDDKVKLGLKIGGGVVGLIAIILIAKKVMGGAKKPPVTDTGGGGGKGAGVGGSSVATQPTLGITPPPPKTPSTAGAVAGTSSSIKDLTGAWVGGSANLTTNIMGSADGTGTMLDHSMFPNTKFTRDANNNIVWTVAANPADGSKGIGVLSPDGNTISWDNNGVWVKMAGSADQSVNPNASSANGAEMEYSIKGMSIDGGIVEKLNATGVDINNLDGTWYDNRYNTLHIKNNVVSEYADRGSITHPSRGEVEWQNTLGKISKNGDTIVWDNKSKYTRYEASTKPTSANLALLKGFLNGDKSASTISKLLKAHMINSAGEVEVHG